MSLCYDFEKWTMITFGLIATSLTVGLVLISMQVVNGQNNETETAKTKVDKLIEDTKRENTTKELYRAELIQECKIQLV